MLFTSKGGWVAQADPGLGGRGDGDRKESCNVVFYPHGECYLLQHAPRNFPGAIGTDLQTQYECTVKLMSSHSNPVFKCALVVGTAHEITFVAETYPFDSESCRNPSEWKPVFRTSSGTGTSCSNSRLRGSHNPRRVWCDRSLCALSTSLHPPVPADCLL